MIDLRIQLNQSLNFYKNRLLTFFFIELMAINQSFIFYKTRLLSFLLN